MGSEEIRLLNANEVYPDNGTTPAAPADPPPPHPLPRWAYPRQVFDVLKGEPYQVPETLIEQLKDSLARAVANLVDEALAQKKVPQGYYIVRRLNLPNWLR
jgi:hypothetical protein